ncbi:DUF2520 domain-containing protein [Legionella geestiana]|nr:DUF2520 domain-containing protein [Legionella geestiana]
MAVMSLSVNIIGAGRLGQTLGRLLTLHQAATINGLCNAHLESARAAADRIGAGKAFAEIHALPPADISFITTPDSAISDAASMLAESPNLKPKSIVLHCSGVENSDLLAALKARDCFVASVHPMRSFANPEQSALQFAGTFAAIEGDAPALECLEPLFSAIGARSCRIAREGKAFYHAAGVFASNYVVTLAEHAKACLNAAGIDDTLAMAMLTNILGSTVANLEASSSPECALTGPINRGDIATLEKHLKTLGDSKDARLYAELGLATLRLTHHAPETLAQMEKVFRTTLESIHG